MWSLSWVQWISLTSAALSILFNLSILPIISFYSGRHIGRYKYLLFLYTTTSIMYSTAHIIFLPNFYVSELGYIFYATTSILPRPYGLIIIFVFVSCYVQLAAVQCLSFVYRSGVMCRRATLEWFHEPQKCCVMVAFFLFCIIFMVVMCVFGMLPNEVTDRRYEQAMYSLTNYSIHEIAYIGEAVIIEGKINWRIALAYLSFVMYIFPIFIIISICVHKIMREFKLAQHLSVNVQNAQKSLFTLLLLQTAVPFVFTISPPLTSVFLSFFCSSYQLLPYYLGSVISFAQLLDPLLMLYFIRDYRRVILRIVRWDLSRTVSMATSSHN